MSTATFTSVASHVVGQYSQIGKIIVGTYRTGAQRLVANAGTRYSSFIDARSLPLVDDTVKASLIDVQRQLTGAVVDGINSGTHRVEQAIEFVAGGVNGGIAKVAATADRVESAFNTQALSTVGSLTLPVAHVSLALANRAVEGTKRLSQRVLGAEETALEAAPAKRAAKKAVRRTAKARA